MNTFDAICARHSTRSFQASQIPDEALEKIIFAGGQAAIGCADFDSLKLIVVQNPELLAKIDSSASGGNPQSHPLYGCPTLVVVIARENRLANIELSNAGCIIQNMMVQAADFGIDSVYLWMGMSGINRSEELQKELQLPEGFKCVGTMALGYAEKSFPKLRAAEQRIAVSYIR